MKQHIVFSLLLIFAATAAQANLFDRIKQNIPDIQEAIQEVKESMEVTESKNDGERESADSSGTGTVQDAAISNPGNNKSLSQSTISDSSTGQSLYGWLDRVNYSQGKSPLTEGLGLKNAEAYINLSVFGVTTRITREIKCNALFLDSFLPNIDGISVGDLRGKSARDIDQAFAAHRGKFIRLNKVQVHLNRNQKLCVASSVEIVNDFSKTNVEFPEVNNQYLRRVFDVAARAGIGELETYAHLKPAGNHYSSIGPDEYDCNRFQWSSADSAKALSNEFQQNNFQSLNTAKIILVGVQPILDKIGICKFDRMNIVANEAEGTKTYRSQSDSTAMKSSLVTESDVGVGKTYLIEKLNVLVRHTTPSAAEVCNQRKTALRSLRDCDLKGAKNLSPQLAFYIHPNEDMSGISNRALNSRNTVISGYWQLGHMPGRVDYLEKMKGETVTLHNVIVPASPFSKDVFFEKVSIPD